MAPKTFLKIFFMTTVIGGGCFSTHAYAQSQTVQPVNQQPESVYTYHGQVIAPPPQGELTPIGNRTVTSSELVVEHRPSVDYPNGEINEPVALDDASSTHEASLVTTKQTYDGNGKLITATQVDHVNQAR